MNRLFAFLAALFLCGSVFAADPDMSIYRPVTTQILTSGSTSVSVTNAFGSFIRVVRIHPTEDIFMTLGSTPQTAVSTDMLLPADTTEYFRVSPGEYIAVIQSSTGGTVYVTEMDR